MVASAIIRRRRGSTSLLSLYSALGIRPDLALDFDNERYFVDRVPTTFSSAITHTRASTATYVDSNGILQTAAINEPRVGHHVWNGTAWVNEGLLHESEARTNLFAQSNDFSTWSSTNTTVTDNAVTGLDGLTSASTVLQTSTTASQHFINTTAAVTSGTTYTFSAFVKYVDWRYVNLDVSDGSFGNPARATFDLVNGVVTDGSNGTDTIENWGNGWWRIAMSVPATATNTSSFFVSFNSGSTFNNTFNGNGTSSFVIFGAQLEAAPTPSSYIPTSGSTVTRSADVLTIPAANLPYPEPVVIGPELVTNGTFDTDIDGWISTSSAGGSIAWNPAGYLDLVNATGASRARQLLTLDTAKVYQLVVTNVLGGGVSVFYQGLVSPFPSVELGTLGAGQTKTFIFVGQYGANSAIDFRNFGTGTTVSLDNISVREINPLALSIQMDGRVTYADEGTFDTLHFVRWQADFDNRIRLKLDTDSTRTGRFVIFQEQAGVEDGVVSADNAYSAGVFVPFNIASRHGSTFVNGATDGTALTANTTPVALPNLSATNLSLGDDYNGTIRTFRIWGQDIGDAGLVEATT